MHEIKDIAEAGQLNLVNRHNGQITVDYLKQKFPKKKNTITEETVELIEATISDPLFNGYNLIDTMMDYEKEMYDGKASINDYINAIKFCSFLEGDNSSIVEAYTYTFSKNDFVRARMEVSTASQQYKELTTAASRYRKRPLVKAILTRANMSLYLMFQRNTYEAVQVLTTEMKEAMYSKDRISAADKLLTHVKAPEELNIGLNVAQTEDSKSAMDRLFEQIAVSALSQKARHEAGEDLDTVQSIGININDDVIEAEVDKEEVNPDDIAPGF